MLQTTQAVRRATIDGLDSAVHRSKALSKAGLLERLFTFAFRGLVYPQIWEDPAIDMEALAIQPGDHIVAIASGSCNVLSYLTADPARISAIDLNGAHIALGRLKACALARLPTYDDFFAFFGTADSPANLEAYRRHVQPHLDPISAAYWNGRRGYGPRRIAAFSRNFYRFGLLGTFIGSMHLLGRLYRCDPSAILKARSLAEQREIFDAKIAPIFDKGLARWISRQPASLFGLGIPPSQYRKLAADLPGGIFAVLRHRLERLACDFEIGQNYFAWQAFGRRYATGGDDGLPPYLQRRHHEAIRTRADRVSLRQQSMTEFLATQPAASVDCVVLLDAQDWMGDADLTALWTEITRAARPGARVIFRTAADERRLMDRVYTRQRHIYDASRKFYLLGRDGLIADLAPPPDARILEIACGTGRNLIAIARHYPRTTCYGFDLSTAMLATARSSVARAKLGDRITLAAADATTFDPIALFGVADFDRIVISYALSMIPPWREVLRHAARFIAPGGALHVVDFGDQARLPVPFKRLLEAWLARFHVSPRADLPSKIEAVAREHDFVAGTKTLYRGYAIKGWMKRL